MTMLFCLYSDICTDNSQNIFRFHHVPISPFISVWEKLGHNAGVFFRSRGTLQFKVFRKNASPQKSRRGAKAQYPVSRALSPRLRVFAKDKSTLCFICETIYKIVPPQQLINSSLPSLIKKKG